MNMKRQGRRGSSAMDIPLRGTPGGSEALHNTDK